MSLFYSLNIFTKLSIGALSGFEYVAILAGETRAPARDIGRSVLIASPIIALALFWDKLRPRFHWRQANRLNRACSTDIATGSSFIFHRGHNRLRRHHPDDPSNHFVNQRALHW